MSEAQRRTSPWVVAGFLAVASAINYGDRAAISSVLPSLQTEFGLSDAALGLVGSVFLWTYALASPFAGTVADRCSRSRVVLLSLVAWSVVTVLIGASAGIATLLILRGGLGLAECLYLPAAIALTADHHGPRTRAKALSLLNIGNSLGVVAGGAGAGYIADRFGWRASFWVLGAIGLVVALFGRPALSDAPARHTARRATAPAIEAARYLALTPSYLILLLKAMLSGVAIWIFLSWLPLYFKESYGMSLGDSGLTGTLALQGAALVGMVIGGAISDAVAARTTRSRVLMHACCYIVSAPFLLAFLGHPGFAVSAAAVGAFSFSRSLGGANEQPILCDVVPPRYRSTAIGFMNMCATATGGLGVFAAGLLKSHVGLSAIFGWLSVSFLIAGCALLLSYVLFMPRDIARAQEEEARGSDPAGNLSAGERRDGASSRAGA